MPEMVKNHQTVTVRQCRSC